MVLFKSSFVLFCFIFFTQTYSSSSISVKPSLSRSYELSIINQVNDTGHCIINFALMQASRGVKRNWEARITHEIFEDGGMEKHFVTGKLTVPPPKPRDYEFFPGIGYYKFHTDSDTLHGGMSTCAREGGHLLIVNSLAEAKVAKKMYARYPDVWDWANIGFYDQAEDGNYKTIYGKSLESAGYSEWYPGEPDHSYGPAYCGVIHRDGRLGAGVCEKKRPFICEYDLHWGL